MPDAVIAVRVGVALLGARRVKHYCVSPNLRLACGTDIKLHPLVTLTGDAHVTQLLDADAFLQRGVAHRFWLIGLSAAQ